MRILAYVGLASLLLAVLVSCSPLPAANSYDLAPHRLAMRPAFQNELESLGPIPRYRIDIQVDPTNLMLTGRQQVHYTNRGSEKLRDLCFRLLPNLPSYDGEMQVTRVQIGDREIGVTYEMTRTVLTVPLSRELPPDGAIDVTLDFTLRLKHKDDDRVLLGERQNVLSLPNFHPLLAVRENGSWNESVGPAFADAAFSEVSLYRVNVSTPPGVVVVSSGSVITDTLAEDGQRVVQTVTGPAREYGLIVSRDYRKHSLSVRGVQVNSYYLPEDEKAGYSALWRAAAALQVYGEAFGEYPYTKLDLAEAPLGKRGMEYPALILVGSDTYRTERKRMEPLVAHETAHQWWYNLVGSDPVAAPAVDEALAEYSMYLYYEELYGRDQAERLLAERWREPVAYAKKTGLDAPVEQPAAGFVPENYEPIVYGKGALLWSEVRQTIGDQAFFTAIRNYLRNYRYRIAPPGALLGLASGVSPKNLDSLAEKWRDSIAPSATPAP